MTIPAFELGHTVQFTWVASVPPDAPPIFAVRRELDQVYVSSVTAISSSSTAFYSLFTIPTSPANTYYTGEWLAQKTVQGSAYDFISRFSFLGQRTEPQ